MRRFFWGLAIASLTVSAPVTAFAGDREIADSIISSIKKQQASGSLKGFDIDLSVESGVVTLTGSVANSDQAKAVLAAAHEAAGVVDVVDQISLRKVAQPGQGNTPLATVAPGEKSGTKVVQVSNVEAAHDLPIPMALEVKPEPKASGNQAVVAQAVVAQAPAVPAEPPKMVNTPNAGVSSIDAAITDDALGRLSQAKSSGALRQFEIDLSTVDGEVWVKGTVANSQQKQLVLTTLQHVQGVKKIIDDLAVADGKSRTLIQPASDSRVSEVPQLGSMPVVGSNAGGPRPFAPSMVTNYDEGIVSSGPIEGMPVGVQQGMMQSPVPMNMGPSYGAGVPRYDQPQMPGYAWPSYAAYPNYAAVTYPKQYSASAWPYIGPFYPYPQVPLGWRRVALEWDDGLWYLDFTSK